MKNERYPHVVYEEKAKAANSERENFGESIVPQPMTTQEMEGLLSHFSLKFTIMFMY